MLTSFVKTIVEISQSTSSKNKFLQLQNPNLLKRQRKTHCFFCTMFVPTQNRIKPTTEQIITFLVKKIFIINFTFGQCCQNNFEKLIFEENLINGMILCTKDELIQNLNDVVTRRPIKNLLNKFFVEKKGIYFCFLLNSLANT